MYIKPQIIEKQKMESVSSVFLFLCVWNIKADDLLLREKKIKAKSLYAEMPVSML